MEHSRTSKFVQSWKLTKLLSVLRLKMCWKVVLAQGGVPISNEEEYLVVHFAKGDTITSSSIKVRKKNMHVNFAWNFWTPLFKSFKHKVHIYRTTVSVPSFELGSPTPSPASECVPPFLTGNQMGRGHTSLRVRGWRGPSSVEEKKPTTLSTLWVQNVSLQCSILNRLTN